MSQQARSRRRLIAVNRFYAPDVSATSQMVTDLATHLAAEGVPTCAVASRAAYAPLSEGSAQALPLREVRDGVEIRRDVGAFGP